MDEYIENPAFLKEKIRAINEVRDVKERLRFGILLGKDETTLQAVGVGLDLKNNEFNLSEKLKNGSIDDTGIYIGTTLAKQLGVNLGEKLLIATKTSEGGLNGIKLPVKGIFHFGIIHFDKKIFFIGLGDAKRLLKLKDHATELYITLKDRERTIEVQEKIKKFLPDYLVAQNYKEQLGNLYDTFVAMQKIYIFVEIIILFLTSFVIINTMMMAIFERMREIGALKAMGMTNRELFLNFTIEGSLIGSYGGVLGAIVGYCLVLILGYYGINLEDSLRTMDAPIEYVIRPNLKFVQLLIAIAICLIVPALAAMIPARFIKKLTPAEALRK
jgi:putative ABC transport system permease protein